MVVEYPIEKSNDLISLFQDHKNLTTIINSLLLGRKFKILVDDQQHPKVALISHPDFNILSGDRSNAATMDLLSYIPRHRLIVVPNEEWASLLKNHYGIRLIPSNRTKFSSKELRLEHIRDLKKDLPEGFVLELVTKDNVTQIYEKMDETRMIIDLFGSTDEFLENGFAYCIKHNDDVVSVATAGHPPINGAFEIQVETINSPEYRRKGLATVACANLIEYALENGLEPRWDAADERSAQFAQKLGYCDPEQYEVYFYTRLFIAILRKLKILKALRIIIQFFKPNAFEN